MTHSHLNQKEKPWMEQIPMLILGYSRDANLMSELSKNNLISAKVITDKGIPSAKSSDRRWDQDKEISRQH